MTDHLSFNAARGSRRRDETAQRDGRQRSRRATLTNRDLAELEALLLADLQRSPSPSVAADDDSEQSGQLRYDAEPARRMPSRKAPAGRHGGTREFPLSRIGTRGGKRLEDVPPAPRFRRLADDAPRHAAPPVGQRSLLVRAMRVGATVFSAVALVGVSALLVLLAASREWPVAPIAEDTARTGRAAVAVESAMVPSPPAERVNAPVATGATEIKRDASRILSEEFTAVRGGGVVRAIDAQEASAQTPQPAQSWPAPIAPVVRADDATEASPGAGAVAEEPAAPTEIAAEPALPQPTEQAAATHSAQVTTHVNMRATPDNDAAVLAVVPAGRNVGVVECTRWCEVVYGGQQGFIHRRFMSGVQE